MAEIAGVAAARPRCGGCAFWVRAQGGWGLCEVARWSLPAAAVAVAGGASEVMGELGFDGVQVVSRTHEDYGCILAEPAG